MNINDYKNKGLNQTKLEANIKKYGFNRLPKKRKKTLIGVYFEQYKNPIIYILLFAAFVAFSIKEYSDALFIFAVLFINSVIGTYQEYRAEIKAQSLEESFKIEAMVIRDGKLQKIASEDLTVGDLIVLESGTKIPADIELINSKDLYVDESLLTGESVAIVKEYDNPKSNRVFAGTIVTRGRAVGKVFAIGLGSQIGKIATLLAKASKGQSPLEIRIKKLSLAITKAISLIITLIFIIGIFKGIGLSELLFLAIALIVSAIPEGLPIAITVALSSASFAMSKKGVIIRKLSAIEALGSCTLIASDKTGTLTKNELSVDRFVPFKKEKLESKDSHYIKIGSLLCSEMQYEYSTDGLIFEGDQVDIALAKHAITPDEEYLLAVKEYEKIDDIPYESQNRYSAVMVQKDGMQYEFIKGSPETVLESCTLTAKEKEDILKEVSSFASKGFRNIAIGYKKERTDHNSKRTITLDGFEYLGFMAIIDPIRPESFKAVRSAKKAGIEVLMITGDHPNTAFYIARELGICESKNQIMDYEDIVKWKNSGANPDELKDIKVFSRTKPQQKKDIVCALQDIGHFVAVTGDGVNDAPALKHANIGIAMGKEGTDIAKSAGEIILTDDNFSSIISGIKEGRRAYDNIRKVVYLLISTGFAELVLICLVFLTGLPLPLLPVQILWLNLVTNGLQDVFLAFESAEKGILKRKPREPNERIFNSIMIKRVLVGGLYMAFSAFVLFYILLENGYDEYSARNITLLLMVLFENIHVFNSRSEVNFLHKVSYRKSYLLMICVLFTQILHIGSMNIEFMQNLLSLEPVDFGVWFLLLPISFGLMFVLEIEKYIRKAKMPG